MTSSTQLQIPPATAYDAAARRAWGATAFQNFPDQNQNSAVSNGGAAFASNKGETNE
jgi:hypothetical protein